MGLKVIRWMTFCRLSWVASLAVVAALVFVELAAEAWLPMGLLLFAPPALFILPFAVLSPVAVWRKEWRHVALHAGCAGFVLFVFATFRFNEPAPIAGGAVAVVTHNIGQGDRDAFQDSFGGEQLDVVLLQDAQFRKSLYARKFPGFHTRGNEQFLLMTPHTVLRADLVPVKWRGRPVAARYELVIRGREIAVYNVHLPTPRPSLKRIVSPRVWLEMTGLAETPTDGFPSYRAWLDARMELGRSLAAVFGEEKLPFLVGGDFNMPDHGLMYRVFTEKMRDAFADAGRGWGFTFPGAKDSVVGGMFGPWLRIDYLFAGRGWEAAECRVADDEISQHRAVFARFNPIK